MLLSNQDPKWFMSAHSNGGEGATQIHSDHSILKPMNISDPCQLGVLIFLMFGAGKVFGLVLTGNDLLGALDAAKPTMIDSRLKWTR
jgi:hypothetical protein